MLKESLDGCVASGVVEECSYVLLIMCRQSGCIRGPSCGEGVDESHLGLVVNSTNLDEVCLDLERSSRSL